MTYESWRISFQNSELAAKAAYRMAAQLQAENRKLKTLVANLESDRYKMLDKYEGTPCATIRYEQELKQLRWDRDALQHQLHELRRRPKVDRVAQHTKQLSAEFSTMRRPKSMPEATKAHQAQHCPVKPKRPEPRETGYCPDPFTTLQLWTLRLGLFASVVLLAVMWVFGGDA